MRRIVPDPRGKQLALVRHFMATPTILPDGKRVFDVLTSVLILAITSPVILLAMLGIKLTSPGPVFYVAERAGKNGKLFRMHKLRTMNVRKPGSIEPVITGPNDARIFKFGRFLRATKIDELPQFYDVLRGKMSVVGPRPEDPQVVQNYYTEEQMKTLEVKPGITSPAALMYSTLSDKHLNTDDVVGSYVDRVLVEKLKMEQDYIDHANLKTDLKIIFMSVHYVLRALFNYVSGARN